MLRKKEEEPTEIKSILAEDLKIDGNIFAEGKIRIDGEVNGNINGEFVILGESSRVKGDINTQNLVVMGTVEGNIKTRFLELKAGSKVVGDISSEKLVVEPGASIRGNLNVGIFLQEQSTDSSSEE